MRIKMSRFKLAFIVLLIATIVWGIVFYWSLQEYYKYVKECGMWAIPKPYFTWDGAIYIIISGVVLLCAWIVFGVHLWGHLCKKSTQQNMVNFQQYPLSKLARKNDQTGAKKRFN